MFVFGDLDLNKTLKIRIFEFNLSNPITTWYYQISCSSDNEIRQVFPIVKLRKKAQSEKKQQLPVKKDYGTIKVYSIFDAITSYVATSIKIQLSYTFLRKISSFRFLFTIFAVYIFIADWILKDMHRNRFSFNYRMTKALSDFVHIEINELKSAVQ